ncbi:MAG: glycosyl hydrolase-related protein, partial [Chloroflexota bacterium]
AILRVFDSLGSRRKAQFEFGAEINSAAETDLLEENPQPLETNEQGFSDRLSAYEIKSYRLNF